MCVAWCTGNMDAYKQCQKDLEVARSEVEDLKEQLDLALESEEILNTITSQKLELEEVGFCWCSPVLEVGWGVFRFPLENRLLQSWRAGCF